MRTSIRGTKVLAVVAVIACFYPAKAAMDLAALSRDMHVSNQFISPVDQKNLYFWIRIPSQWDADNRLPLLVIMHGTTCRNGQGEWDYIERSKELYGSDPHIIIEPQCPGHFEECCWTSKAYNTGSQTIDIDNPPIGIRLVNELVEAVLSELNLNDQRVYIMGGSNGGYAAWFMLITRPQIYTGALIFCGAGDPTKANRVTEHWVWNWHCSDDGIVPVSGSDEMVAAIEAAGGTRVKYNRETGCGHSAWEPAFAEPTLWTWMFSKTTDAVSTGSPRAARAPRVVNMQTAGFTLRGQRMSAAAVSGRPGHTCGSICIYKENGKVLRRIISNGK